MISNTHKKLIIKSHTNNKIHTHTHNTLIYPLIYFKFLLQYKINNIKKLFHYYLKNNNKIKNLTIFNINT